MPDGEGINPQKIIREMNRQFEEAIVVTDVGQHQMWVTQYLEMTEKKQLLTSGGLGTMGYGLPAALGAQLGVSGYTGHLCGRRRGRSDDNPGNGHGSGL